MSTDPLFRTLHAASSGCSDDRWSAESTRGALVERSAGTGALRGPETRAWPSVMRMSVVWLQ